MQGIQGVLPVNGLTYSEVILGILLPLVLASFAYTWAGVRSLWAGIQALRVEFKTELKDAIENDIKHLEERITRLEDAK